ncbi:MAG: energy transducer TonB [Candidatus Omnitrophica bacterium]|nr:energy transducer TonB [Candidatus Omnitrophota bacterium]
MILSDKIFRNAVVASLIFHVFFFYNWPPLKKFFMFKPVNNIKMTYVPVKQVPISSDSVAEKEKIRKFHTPSTSNKNSEAVKIKGETRPIFKPKSTDKLSIKIKDITTDKQISLMPSQKEMLISHKDKDFSDQPTYLNYYNAVRGKIYDAAQASKPYYAQQGDVRLIFTLARSGQLLNVDIVSSGSSYDPVLRRHALMSIKKATPFPAFLESMKEGHLTLRLTISFEK